MSLPKFVTYDQKHTLFSNFARFCTPKRCTCIHCLVLKNNTNYVNFFYEDDIQLQIQVAPPGMHLTHKVHKLCKRSLVITLTLMTYVTLLLPGNIIQLLRWLTECESALWETYIRIKHWLRNVTLKTRSCFNNLNYFFYCNSIKCYCNCNVIIIVFSQQRTEARVWWEGFDTLTNFGVTSAKIFFFKFKKKSRFFTCPCHKSYRVKAVLLNLLQSHF